MAAYSRPHKLWTREECLILESTGLIDPGKYELIEGELNKKMSKNTPHVVTLMFLGAWLRAVFGEFRVMTEAPLDVAAADNPMNAPEPDLIVRKEPVTIETSSETQAHEVALVIEIADTTLLFDLNVKAPLYARAGIEEYWVCDINGRQIIAHREPVEGSYRSVTNCGAGSSVSPLAAPHAALDPGDGIFRRR